MKTKTNSFTKVINFCVLALFFISTLIIFTSCDNGNSPNDNINQQQNNNSQTDYCEICDGLQTENCGIKHKCDDENCVEYSDNRIYKNGHTHDYCNEEGCVIDDKIYHTEHDYCERTDCDGSTHMGADHPTGPTYPEWFKETPIGGEGSPIKIRYVDLIEQPDSGTPAEKNQDRVDQYKKYIESFKINNELSNVKLDNTVDSFDALIGSTDDNSYYNKNGINDICKPAIETITKNIAISGNNALDKDKFSIYYWAISNEIYKLACGDRFDECGKTNYEEQKGNADSYSIIGCWAGIHNDADITPEFDIYNNDGTLNQKVITHFDEMINAAATKLKNQGVTVDDLYNFINLSLTPNAIRGTHDYDASSINHSISGTCTENEMVDVIDGVEVDKMTPIAQAKLNKSIFSHDYGRELV